MLNMNDFKSGDIKIYSDFYDKSYAIIELIDIDKRYKDGHFGFNAKMIDNSHYDAKTIKPNGSISHYGNSFIYNDLDDLRLGSENYKKQQVRILDSLIK